MNAHAVPYPFAKKVTDKGISSLLLVAFGPVFVVAYVAIGIDGVLFPQDRGPWLYRERRVSRGREFDLLKFRTLRRAALERQRHGEAHARLLENDHENLTWAGRRILKPWYLDELPQLFNILRGDMSLVGPRPWPPSMVRDQVAAGLDYRNQVLPGWTGPVQVQKGSSSLPATRTSTWPTSTPAGGGAVCDLHATTSGSSGKRSRCSRAARA